MQPSLCPSLLYLLSSTGKTTVRIKNPPEGVSLKQNFLWSRGWTSETRPLYAPIPVYHTVSPNSFLLWKTQHSHESLLRTLLSQCLKCFWHRNRVWMTTDHEHPNCFGCLSTCKLPIVRPCSIFFPQRRRYCHNLLSTWRCFPVQRTSYVPGQGPSMGHFMISTQSGPTASNFPQTHPWCEYVQ